MSRAAIAPAPPGDAAGPRRAAAVHLVVLLAFVVLAVLLTWPLARHLDTEIPGEGAGDNVVFLWNIWWMRRVIAAHGLLDPFVTGMQFHPRVDLVLHTHTAANALLGATLFGGASNIAALNLTILLNTALNGFCAYLLAWRATHVRGAALAGGAAFASCAPLAGTLVGHFNFHTAWGLPLFAYAFLEGLDGASWRWSLAAGAALAAVAYTDYYYFVYLLVFAGCVLAYRSLQPAVHADGARPQTIADRALLGVACAAAAGAIAVALTGGVVATIGGLRVSLRTGTNLRALAAAAVLCWLWRRWRPRFVLERATRPHGTSTRGPDGAARRPATLGADARQSSTALVCAAVLMLPLIAHAAALWRAGDYVSQTYFWRSAPGGADLGGLVSGNPFNALWGSAVSRAYAALHMERYDGPLWMGIVPVVLYLTRRSWLPRGDARAWLLVAALFLLWTIGPYLTVFGLNTGLPMPQMLARFVPVVANARVPARAVIVVDLAVAVLLSMALAAGAWRSPRRQALVIAIVLLDGWSSPIRTARLERPAVYTRLASLPDAAVLEVPFGVRDGFGEEGAMDVATLYYQTIHGKPLIGGYVSRLPPSVRARFARPPFDTLLALSAGKPAPHELTAGEGRRTTAALARLGVGYVVVNAARTPQPLLDFVASMPLTLVSEEGTRRLYRLGGGS